MNALASLGATPRLAAANSTPTTASLHRENPELKRAFTDFVGQTFYGQMLQSLRSTVDKPAYFHGGRAEEMFQEQMDQVLSERLSAATAENFSGPMFDLFCLQQSR